MYFSVEALLIFLICLAGGFIVGVTTFGYSIITMALLPLVLEIKNAAMVSLVSSVIVLLVILYDALLRMKIKLKINLIIVPVVCALIGRNIGVFIFQSMNSVTTIILLCILLIVLNLYYIIFPKGMKIRPNAKTAAGAGIVSGVFGGLYNIGGPPLVIYFSAVEEDKIKCSAYIQTIIIISVAYSIAMHTAIGNIDTQIIRTALPAIIGAAVGTILGFGLFKKMDKSSWNKYVRAFVVLSSAVLLIRTIVELN